MSTRKKSGDDWGSWVLIVALFALGIWPIALILLMTKLFASDNKQTAYKAPPPFAAAPRQGTAAPPPPQAARPQYKAPPPFPAQAGPAARAVRSVTRTPEEKKSTARILRIAGAVLACIGLFITGGAFEDLLYYALEGLRYWLPDLLRGLSFLAGGGAMVYSGFAMDRALRRYAKYLAIVGQREAVTVEELSRKMGLSAGRVERDLQKMTDKDYFGPGAYLDMEQGCLFRSGEAGESWRRSRETAPPPPKEAEEGFSGILRDIRRVNDEIADPALSAKIDRLEEISAKIFRAVETDPRKREKIGTLLNYYLPTTQKLLDSYAQFESAGIEGENLRQAKEQISSTMDSIVKGFEHQLDELYKADVLDVDSDIRVMEHMLRRDTATAEDDFGLGGAALRQTEE